MDARAAAKLEAELQALFAPCLGAYSPRTFKGYAADLRVFAAWCDAHQCRWLPALPHDIARFIDAQAEQQQRLSTLKRRVFAIAFAHRMRELRPPTGHTGTRPSRPQPQALWQLCYRRQRARPPHPRAYLRSVDDDAGSSAGLRRCQVEEEV